eukprot:1935954-Rhodomonas_salina.1
MGPVFSLIPVLIDIDGTSSVRYLPPFRRKETKILRQHTHTLPWAGTCVSQLKCHGAEGVCAAASARQSTASDSRSHARMQEQEEEAAEQEEEAAEQ